VGAASALGATGYWLFNRGPRLAGVVLLLAYSCYVGWARALRARAHVRTHACHEPNVESSGEVVLRLLDRSGTIRVKLGASESGSGLMLADESIVTVVK
jgi:hypothetical protein